MRPSPSFTIQLLPCSRILSSMTAHPSEAERAIQAVEAVGFLVGGDRACYVRRGSGESGERMLQFLKTWRKLVVASLLLLFSSLIWISNAKEEKDRNFIDRSVVTITAPFESLAGGAIRGVKHVWYGYFYFVGLEQANEQLRKDNDVLRGQLADDWEVQDENDRLRKMLAFEKETPAKLVPAKVIA